MTIEASKLIGKFARLVEGAAWVNYLVSHLYISIVFELVKDEQVPPADRDRTNCQQRRCTDLDSGRLRHDQHNHQLHHHHHQCQRDDHQKEIIICSNATWFPTLFGRWRDSSVTRYTIGADDIATDDS